MNHKISKNISIQSSLKARDVFQGNINDNIDYELSSIVLHSGNSANEGHYYSITKNIYDEKWRVFNDEEVTEIYNIEDILSNPNSPVLSQSYILFYVNKNINDYSYSNLLLCLNDKLLIMQESESLLDR